jgi:hypothetical protein
VALFDVNGSAVCISSVDEQWAWHWLLGSQQLPQRDTAMSLAAAWRPWHVQRSADWFEGRTKASAWNMSSAQCLHAALRIARKRLRGVIAPVSCLPGHYAWSVAHKITRAAKRPVTSICYMMRFELALIGLAHSQSVRCLLP